MMITSIFLRGFIIGLFIAIPVGPIGILCVRRTLSYGYWSGLASGLGAATADSFYGIIAAFGLTFIADFLIGHQLVFRIVGGIFLGLLGLKTVLSKAQPITVEATHTNIIGDYFSALVLTLTNPLTILAFAALFAALGLSEIELTYFAATRLVLGVFCGSAVWWLLLTAGIGIARSKINPSFLYKLHKISGVLLLIFGVFLTLSGICRTFIHDQCKIDETTSWMC